MTQQDIFGGERKDVDVQQLLHAFPAARTDTHLFANLIAKRKLTGFADKSEVEQNQIIDLIHQFPTLDRQRRLANEEDSEAKH